MTRLEQELREQPAALSRLLSRQHSRAAELYFLPVGRNGKLGDVQTLKLSGPASDTSAAFNLNGIAAVRGGKSLLLKVVIEEQPDEFGAPRPPGQQGLQAWRTGSMSCGNLDLGGLREWGGNRVPAAQPEAHVAYQGELVRPLEL